MKLFIAIPLFMVVCLIPTIRYVNASEGEKTGTADGRRMSREAQLALVEAQQRIQTNPEDWASAREPLVEFLATPQEDPVPITMYKMLGYLWYFDEKNETHVNEAYKIYKAGHEAFPSDLELLRNYASVSYHLDMFLEAAPLFEKYYDLDEKHEINYLENAAKIFFTAENLKEAKRVYLRMIGLSDTPKINWFDSLIYICQAQENAEDAEKFIRLALEHFPMEKKYWEFLGYARSEKEDFEGTAACFEIATRVQQPDDTSEWQKLIDLYNYIGLPLRSARSIQEGIDILAKASTEEEQHIAVAEAYARGLRVDKAVASLDSAIAKNPSYALKLKKAEILYNARRNQEALAALDDCIATNKEAYEAYYMRGWIAWDMKDWDTAIEAFDAAAASRDNNIRINATNALDMLASLNKAKNE